MAAEKVGNGEFRLVKTARVAACMTCPLCHDLLEEATAITECLHTFCRKCIYDKIEDEDLECCPICEVHLGFDPLEKMRPDPTLQGLRDKLFPSREKMVKASEVVPWVPLPVRRKEKSLSSLDVSTQKVSTRATKAGKRTKPTRKASGLQSPSSSIEKAVKKEEESLEDHEENSSSPESPDTSNRIAQSSSYMSLSPCEDSQSVHNEGNENDMEELEAKLDLLKPLNVLAEGASRRKSFKCHEQGSDAKQAAVEVNESDSQVQKAKKKKNRRKVKVEDEKISTDPVSSDTAKSNKLPRVQQKMEPNSEESGKSPQAVEDATSSKPSRNGPIWFSLVAYEEGDAPLPQIPSSYIRIMDGSRPISYIQKYLKEKLDLTSEAEVEIRCMGEPVLPTTQIHDLADLWLDAVCTTEGILATVGSSAEDFVMVLTYGRKAPQP